ncbi:MAG: helix-turn-helix transcriptional regulator [Clostridium butyricum]|nr:helix-turn-helix transcriptional regulator [Clostridium butyricum]
MSFPEKIKALRKANKLSQEKLAEIMSVSRQAIAKWELGKSYPDINKLIEISNYFNISIDNLLKEKNNDCNLKKNITKIGEYVMDKKIIEFLCRAKRETYASGKAKEEIPCRPNSHDLKYCEGNLQYIDTYLGGEKFVGEEAIWKEKIPLWSMNYVGRVIDEGFEGSFLKEALSLVKEEYPYRGPFIYRNGEFKYECSIEGGFEWFNGIEGIYKNDVKVYECMFHGGIIIN